MFEMKFSRKPDPRIVVKMAVEAAGGTSAVADALGVSRTAVSGWIAAGHVPPKRMSRLSDLAGLENNDPLHDASMQSTWAARVAAAERRLATIKGEIAEAA